MLIKVGKKIPAGLMIIPMFLGVLIKTFCPELLEIGSFTTAVFSNSAATTIMGLQLFCIGSQLRLKDISKVCKRGTGLLGAKFVLGLAMAYLVGNNEVFGISILALVCAISNSNGSIYLSLVTTYGDEVDGAAVTILSLTNGPLFPLLILGMSGIAKYPMILLLATMVPTLLGMILGNLHEEIRTFLKPGVSLLLPFIGFSLGAGININDLKDAGWEGILLSLFVIIIGGVFTVLVDKLLLKRPGYAGLSTCATGANAVAVPAAIAFIDKTWESSVSAATTQLAAAAIIGSIMIPLLVGIFMKSRYLKIPMIK